MISETFNSDSLAIDMFPTVGHAALHILVSHAASHVGQQLIVWRRVVGLGPMKGAVVE